MSNAPHDAFDLYDLRVEVVCPEDHPEGEKMICGAKKGDYFTLEGEMMYLPPGQGISIYSLGEFITLKRPAALSHFDDSDSGASCGFTTTCCQAADDAHE
jgi:uncharacterized repeat protein (TIGR04076 family)